MHKDRKSKLAEAFMARRKKQLACYLASTLGFALTTSICLGPVVAFDAPPATQSKTIHMGSVGVGTSGNGTGATGLTSNTSVDSDHSSNSEALKRVGIRFVAPEGQAKTSGAQLANQSSLQNPNVIQPPMVIAGSGNAANAKGSQESSVAGIRIRIPSDKTSGLGAPAASTNSASANSALSKPSSNGTAVASPNTASLKMTVGTGVAPLPAISSTTTSLSSPPEFKTAPALTASNTPVPVSFGTPMTTATVGSGAAERPSLPATNAPAWPQTSNQQPGVAPRQGSSQPLAQTTSQPSPQAASGFASAPTGFAVPTQTPSSFATPSVAPPSIATPGFAAPGAPKLDASKEAANAFAKPSPASTSDPLSIQPRTMDSQASSAAGGSKLQARLNDGSTMTSRAPGIVRIPSMVVTGAGAPAADSGNATTAQAPSTINNVNASASLAAAKQLPKPGFVGNDSHVELPMLQPSPTQMMQSRAPSLESRSRNQTSSQGPLSGAATPTAVSSSGFQSLPSTNPMPANLSRVATAVSQESLAQAARQSFEQTERAVGATAASTTPKLIPATARANPRYEPSIIPVALLASSATKETASSNPNGQSESSNAEQGSSEPPAPAPMPGPVAAPTTNAITVPLKNIQTIRLLGKISQVEIEDDTVCRVISTEPNTLTVIGASIGDSKLTVWWANPTTKSEEKHDFKVSVRETWGQAAKNTVSIDDVNQSIAALFPGSSVVIKPNSDGSISVHGSATSNESAKQILVLVRKMFLVPVQDRIAIANL